MNTSLRSRKVIAAAVLTVLTVAVVGLVLVALTPVGCGPGNALGMKSISNRCAKTVAGKPGSFQTVVPTDRVYPSPQPVQQPPPYSPPASAPYNPPASGPYPPDGPSASGSYPPFIPPSSASVGFNPAFSLDCRLPVYAGGPGSGGFIVFPGGNFVADPASGVSLPAAAPTPPPSMGPGYGQGYGGMSYDKAFSKWLPVPYSWVSPDGSRYAFPSTNSIWVQNVADSAHVLLGEGQSWNLIAFLSDGVYASNPNAAGLWLLPVSGSPRQVATTGYWRAAASGAAYGTATSAVPQGASNGIIRLDLKTGTITDWFSRSNSQASVLGFDAQGHPLIQVNYYSPMYVNEIWLTTGPLIAIVIGGSQNNPNYGMPPNLIGVPMGDSHGIWFQANQQYARPPMSNSGMVMYSQKDGLGWMSNISGALAGPCA